MSKNRFVRIVLTAGFTCFLAPVLAVGQAAFPSTSIKASVTNHANFTGVRVAGTLTLSSQAVGFDSPDFVFSLPTDDILAVEYQGQRDGFMTLVLDRHSKFLPAYPTLLVTRNNSIGQREDLLILSLEQPESIDRQTVTARSFQAFIRAHRAEREQAMVGGVSVGSSLSSMHPSLGRTLHVELRGGNGSRADGLLTFFPDRLQFDSPDLVISLPVNIIAGVDPAGARETFLMAHVDPRSQLNEKYQQYEVGWRSGNYQFVLDPIEAIAPALRLAQDFQQYVDAVRSGREQAIVNGAVAGGADGSSPGVYAPPPSAPVQPAAGEKRELARYDAGFLEKHNPSNGLVNSFKLINGVPGTVIQFDTGIGYASLMQNPSVKPERQAFLQNGYLKFFIPQEAVLGVRDVSVIRNRNADTNNSFIAEVDIKRNSAFYQQHKQLMTESPQDNCIYFNFKERYQLRQFLQNMPQGAAARDSF